MCTHHQHDQATATLVPYPSLISTGSPQAIVPQDYLCNSSPLPPCQLLLILTMTNRSLWADKHGMANSEPDQYSLLPGDICLIEPPGDHWHCSSNWPYIHVCRSVQSPRQPTVRLPLHLKSSTALRNRSDVCLRIVCFASSGDCIRAPLTAYGAIRQHFIL
jgi:hypothetical protein